MQYSQVMYIHRDGIYNIYFDEFSFVGIGLYVLYPVFHEGKHLFIWRLIWTLCQDEEEYQ